MQIIVKHKPGLLGQIFRMDNSCLIKTVMLGTVEGGIKLADPRENGQAT